MKCAFRFAAILLLPICQVVAQPQDDPLISSRHDLNSLCTEVTPNGWYFFRPQLSGLTDSLLFNSFYRALGLTRADHLQLERTSEDPDGTLHRHYQQYHRGIPVQGAMISTHGNEEQIQILHGKLASRLNREVVPTISSDSAFLRLLDYFHDYRLAWSDSTWHLNHEQELGHSRSGSSTNGQLALVAFDRARDYRLAYRYRVRTIKPDDFWEVWLDAHSGQMIKKRSLRSYCQGADLQGQTQYYGAHEIPSRRRNFPNYDYVLETCGEQSIQTKYYTLNSFGEAKSWGWIQPVKSEEPRWQSHHQAALTAHWAASQTWSYFQNRHNWAGPDGVGGELRILVDWQSAGIEPSTMAYYEPDGRRHYLYFGQRESNTMATLDVVGHEFAHGVIRSTCGLEYEGEPGAWHEALADMLGILVEHEVLAEQSDWVIAREAIPLRNLASPKEFGQPTVYKADPSWVSVEGACNSSNDQCGIHVNSGVGGYWFYLLTSGGQQIGHRVYGIGYEAAAKIIFRAITHYLQPKSNYLDARLATIQAAVDEFGSCSDQVAQVRNAWAAVGVGRPNEQLCIQVQGPDRFCQDESNVMYVFEAQSVYGADIEWILPDAEINYHFNGAFRERLIITDLPDTLTLLNLVIHASMDSLKATQQVSVKAEICQTEQRQEIELPETDQWTVYPNPAQNDVSLFLPEGHYPAMLTVRDPLGRILRQTTLKNQYTRLALDRWTNGVYYLTLEGPDGPEMKSLRILR